MLDGLRVWFEMSICMCREGLDGPGDPGRGG